VPDGTARLRFSFSAVHPDDAIARAGELVRTRVLANR
jgi:7-keto-8-aminopelargonate synthetase-like enzyme